MPAGFSSPSFLPFLAAFFFFAFFIEGSCLRIFTIFFFAIEFPHSLPPHAFIFFIFFTFSPHWNGGIWEGAFWLFFHFQEEGGRKWLLVRSGTGISSQPPLVTVIITNS